MRRLKKSLFTLRFWRRSEGNEENNDRFLTMVCRVERRITYHKENSSPNVLATTLNEKLNEGSFNKQSQIKVNHDLHVIQTSIRKLPSLI
jgi:hypothetical protein